ncbi:MAG: Lrp/AsnC family transcriptional regulator [bacterium]|nr:Lrp/AsnC family transcriptional regulator [bacterium]
MITVLVLMNVEKDKVNNVAEQIAQIDGVREVYSVAGRYDLVVLLQAEDHEGIATLITDNILKVGGISESETLISFRVFSKDDKEGIFSIGMDKE